MQMQMMTLHIVFLQMGDDKTDTKEAVNEETPLHIEVKTPDEDLRYGWGKFRPALLQILNNPKFFTITVSFFSFIQGRTIKLEVMTRVCACESVNGYGCRYRLFFQLALNDYSNPFPRVFFLEADSKVGSNRGKPWFLFGLKWHTSRSERGIQTQNIKKRMRLPSFSDGWTKSPRILIGWFNCPCLSHWSRFETPIKNHYRFLCRILYTTW